MTNPNPNEPNYPYGGGTDNPGDDTSKPGGPTGVQSVETAPLSTPHPTGTVAPEGVHPAIVPTLAQAGSDTILQPGEEAVPTTASGFESAVDRGADPSGGVTLDPISGAERESGQDETAGETETTSGEAPAAFPEPNP